MRIGYFTNQYPAVSHTFIRREIHALEKLDMTIVRYALRSGENLIDPADILEQKQTSYILKANAWHIAFCCLTVLAKPFGIFRALRQAISLGWRSDRGLFRHVFYLAEAVVLVAWCQKDGVQHIHAHFGTNSAAVAMLAGQISGIPYSFTAHGPDEFEKAELLSIGKKLEHAAFAICVSYFGRSQLMRWSRPELWNKIFVVHCGLDSQFLAAPIFSPPASPRVVCVGRIDVQKAQLVLVSAAQRLHRAGIDFELVFVGDGVMRYLLESAIRDAGLQSKTIIRGWLPGDEVKAEILASRALVLPSFAENLPVVIMEALALGRPVVSTYIAGIPELVKPGRSGWLVPAGDDAALADALREVLVAPVEQLAEMGECGRQDVQKNHDILREATKLKTLFEGDKDEQFRLVSSR